jgi:hypothetical protein
MSENGLRGRARDGWRLLRRVAGTPGLPRYLLDQRRRPLPGPAEVVLAMAPVWDTYAPPIGLGYLAAALRGAGHRVAAVDLNIGLFNAAGDADRRRWDLQAGFWTDPQRVEALHRRHQAPVQALLGRVLAPRPRLVGLSVNHHNRLSSLLLARRLRAADPALQIVFGGPACFNRRERGGEAFPKDCFDYLVVGEGEQTLVELLARHRQGRDVRGLPGVVVNDGRRLSELTPRPPLDLRQVAFPTFEEFDLASYRDFRLGLITGRGCVGRCAFCNDHALMGRFRQRPAEAVVDEIEHHLRRNHVRRFDLKDLACNCNVRQLERLADLLLDRRLRISWESQAIPMMNLRPPLLRKLRRAGCRTLIYGLEAGSDPVLKGMNKYFTAAEAQQVIRWTAEAGIGAVVNVMVGFPGETDRELDQTLAFLARNRAYIDSVGCLSTCRVNADSPLHDRREEFGVLLPDAPADRARDWRTADGRNTYEARRRGALRARREIRRLGLPIAMLNLD